MVRPFICVLLTMVAVPTAPAAETLFRYGGETFTPERLSSRMSTLYGALMLEQHEALKTLVDEMVFDVYVEREARRLGKPVLDVGRSLLEVDEPSEESVHLFYQQHQERIGQPFDQVKERLRQVMVREARAKKRAQVLERIKREGHFELLVRAPENISFDIDTRGAPSKGNPNAPITLVEFSDFQCPNCRRAAQLIDTILSEFPDMVKVYYMDFPVNRSGISRAVAHGGVCAAAQGRFWPYHDLAFDGQDSLDHDSPAKLAESLELDTEAFAACMRDSSTRARVEASFRQGRRLGVTATPTLFVDNKPFVSNHLLRDLGAYIRRRRSELGS